MGTPIDSGDTHPAPLSDADWPAEIDDLRRGFAGALNVYRTMAHHPALLRAWTDLRAHVVQNSDLSEVEREVVILRTGHRLGAQYEWDHHVIRARKAGMTDARIATLRGSTDGMCAEDALLSDAVDALIDDARLDAALMAKVTARHGTKGAFDLMATVGFYSTLGFLLNSCGTPVDDDIADQLRQTPFDSAKG